MKKFSKLMSGTAPVVLGLAMVSAPAYAQDQDVQDADAVDEEVIVVTGSRISNPNLELSSPVGVVTSEELELRQTNVAEQFLRELPSAVPSIGSAVNNGNGGSSFVNLRGIGSVRNLVLLDGRRFVPADTTGRVDLNSIPLAVIERTDILTGGATTTYGADAISGVVNFITKRDFAGVEANFSQQITEEGDGNVFRADLTIGANFDDGRGNVVLSVGYQDQDAVFQGDRDFSEFNVSSTTGLAAGSGNAVPANLFFTAQGPLDAAGNATGTTLVGQVDPDGNGFFPGFNGGAGPFNFNPFNIFQTPFERFNIFASGRYELSDAVEVYSQAAFSKQTVSTIIAPGGSFFNTYQINLNNPFLNDGVAQGLCGALALTAGECTAAINTPDGETLADGTLNPDYREAAGLIPRRSVEAGTRNSEFTSTLFNLVVGARGNITDNITWDVSGTYGESERIQRQSGFARFQRLQNALIATDANTCSQSSIAATTNDGLCVPINLLGNLGTISPESIDYVFNLTQQVITTTSIATVNANIAGDLGFGISETPIQFAIGGEYRSFEATRQSDEASQTPGAVVGGGGAAPDIFGEYDVYDAFGEVSIPVFEGQPFAESLTIDLGARYSDYSTAGTEFTWKAGGSWEPVIGLTIRGNYQRSSRAPNIGELFAPVVTGLSNLATDPCAGGAPVGNAALTAVCQAQGAGSVAAIPQPIAGQINITTGGNPDLGVETARTWTVGFIAQPSFVPGLSVSLDYFNIDVSGAVSAPTVGDIVNGCYSGGNLDFNTNVFCQLVERNPTTGGLSGAPNELRGLLLNQSNLGSIATDGLDLSVRYGTDLTDNIGLNLSFDGTWTNKNTFQAFPGGVNRDCVGFYSVNCGSIQPEFTFTQRTTVTFDEVFNLSLRWRFLSGTEQEPLDISSGPNGGNNPAFQGNTALFGDVDFQQIPSESYFDLTGQWDISDNVLLTVTVQNLFDNSPTVVGSNIGTTAFNSGNVYPSTYDTLGRRYGASVKFSF